MEMKVSVFDCMRGISIRQLEAARANPYIKMEIDSSAHFLMIPLECNLFAE